jgi:uncharacterized oxidoreductase
MKLQNNTILITGGSSGIGFEFAKQLIKKGNKVVITGRNKERLEQAKQKLPELHIIQSDVFKLNEIKDLYAKVTKEFPDLNIVINNAGIMKTINMLNGDATNDNFVEEIGINLSGPINMCKVFLPFLKTKKSSALVNISSGLAFVPLPTSPIYCATKAGLHSFTQSLRVQLQKTSVKVFEFAPPATETELLASFDREDMKGVPIMKVDQMCQVCLTGIEKDIFEVRPGASNSLRFMSRVAPNFILKQLSKNVDRMMAKDGVSARH